MQMDTHCFSEDPRLSLQTMLEIQSRLREPYLKQSRFLIMFCSKVPDHKIIDGLILAITAKSWG
jgi:hypothetical protein